MRSAAKYTRIVPNSAWAMPTPQRMKYFHAGSSEACVRYSATSSTVVSVAASMATHMTPRLLVVRTSSMVKVNSWYMGWYRRMPASARGHARARCACRGRENSAVVSATNAVSATRNTFSESMKNCSSSAVSGPSSITRVTRRTAAPKVASEKPAFTSAA